MQCCFDSIRSVTPSRHHAEPWFFQVDSQGRCTFDSLCGLTSKTGFQARCDNVDGAIRMATLVLSKLFFVARKFVMTVARAEGGRPQNLHCAKPWVWMEMVASCVPRCSRHCVGRSGGASRAIVSAGRGDAVL